MGMLLFDVELEHLQQWVSSLGAWGPLFFVSVYAAIIVAAVPAAPLTMAAGALFGSLSGLVWSSIAASLGRAVSFLIARYFARDAASRWLSKNQRLRRLDKLIEQRGPTIVILTRVIPLFPINVLNYGFGLTRINLSTFLFWSWLSTLPATVVYVTSADVVVQTAVRGEIPRLLLATLAVAGITLALLIVRVRKNSKEAGLC